MFLVRPRHQGFIWYYVWEHLLIIYHPAKFCDHSHWDSEDIMFLVDGSSTCSHLNPPLLFISKTHVIKGHCMSYQQVWFWSHTSWVTNYKTLTKKDFSSLFLKHRRAGKGEKTTRKDIAKLFSLHETQKGIKTVYCKAFCDTQKWNWKTHITIHAILNYKKGFDIVFSRCYPFRQTKRVIFAFFI